MGPYVIPECTLHRQPGLPPRPQPLRDSDLCSDPELQKVETDRARAAGLFLGTLTSGHSPTMGVLGLH